MDTEKRLEKLEAAHRRLKMVLAGVVVVGVALAGLAAVQRGGGEDAGAVRARQIIIPGEDGGRLLQIGRRMLRFNGDDGDTRLELTPRGLKVFDDEVRTRVRLELRPGNGSPLLEITGPDGLRRFYYSGGMVNLKKGGESVWLDPRRMAR